MLMCVLLVAVFFVNPLYFTGHHPNLIGGHTGSMRTLSSIDNPAINQIADESYEMGTLVWGMLWLVRVLVAAVCFGWVTLRSLTAFGPSAPEGVKFWRFWKQAQQDLQKVRMPDVVYLLTVMTSLPLSPYMYMYTSLRGSTVLAETVWSQLWQ